MSTPTTATATLPHYSPHTHTHHFRYSHHQHHPHPHQQPSYPQSNSSSYRPPNPILPAASRLAYPSPGYSSAVSHASANGAAAAAVDRTTRLVPHETTDQVYTTMPPAVDSRGQAEPQHPRKRRRSRGPDWSDFYKNGLPQEVIVIDDTPEPDRPNGASTTLSQAQTLVGSSRSQHHATAGSAHGSSAKKRKRADEPTPYDPVHHSAAAGSHTPSKSTAASDRTNSAIHTTAATSLGSLSSNGQYDYGTQPGLKRKRTTRQQIANEARRREAAIYTDALADYRPPPYPPKKARDVHIKVIADVRDHPLRYCRPSAKADEGADMVTTQPPHSKNARVDDDDGHYIVVPDNDLTDRCKRNREPCST